MYIYIHIYIYIYIYTYIFHVGQSVIPWDLKKNQQIFKYVKVDDQLCQSITKIKEKYINCIFCNKYTLFDNNHCQMISIFTKKNF